MMITLISGKEPASMHVASDRYHLLASPVARDILSRSIIPVDLDRSQGLSLLGTPPMEQGHRQTISWSRSRSKHTLSKPTLPSPRDTSCTSLLNHHYGRYLSDRLTVSTQPNYQPELVSPTRILDAPKLEDDFYLNLLDWSTSNNCIAVGLAEGLYCWNATSCQTTSIGRLLRDSRYSSVAWMPKSSILAAGTSNGRIDLYDAERQIRITSTLDHTSRVSVLCWQPGGRLLTSGGRDRTIQHHDPRISRATILSWCAHTQEVCGLKWDSSGRHLATGGNDNKLLVWDGLRQASPILVYTEHTAAVKAIAWSPHQASLLASGGGTADRNIRFWNVRRTDTTSSIKSVATSSQVCNMVWSMHENELITTHGFSDHQCLRWCYPTMRLTGIMPGHEKRVLYLAISPDGTTVVTGSADETLRFWPAFKHGNTYYGSGGTSSGGASATSTGRPLWSLQDLR